VGNVSPGSLLQKYRYYFLAGIAYIALALIVIHAFPINITNSDVPVDVRQADVYLGKGLNPYGQNYTVDVRTNPYNGSQNNIEIVQFLQYPPMMILYYFPFYLLGDVRYGNLVADMIIYGLIVSYFGQKSLERKFAFLFLGNGLNFVVNYYYGGNDIVAGLFVGVSFYLLSKKEKLSAVGYGLSLVTKQLALLALPYFMIKARRRLVYVLLVAITGLLVALPFFPEVIYNVVFRIFYSRIPLVSYLLIFYPLIFIPLVEKYAPRLKGN
jgi:uncharacterized membrane protein